MEMYSAIFHVKGERPPHNVGEEFEYGGQKFVVYKIDVITYAKNNQAWYSIGARVTL